jgi:Cu(I)/Ag(I) efflux system membrane fusion protein
MPASDPAVPPPGRVRGRPALLAARILLVRLRFLAVPVVAFVLVASWPLLHNTWDKLTRTSAARDLEAGGVSTDTEYFCPMCPGVLSDWPGKCPVCNMALVPRKRGEAAALPDGVVARMQLSPYRVELAGIRTAPVAYRPLVHEVETVGVVEADERRSVTVPAPAAGVVQLLLAGPVGSLVKQGEPVAVLRNPEKLDAGRVEALRQQLKKAGVSAEDLKLPAPDGTEGYELTVRAAAAGQVAALPVRKGQQVQPGAALAEIADLSRLCVHAEVFDKDLPFLAEGQAADVSAEAFPGHAPFTGKVRLLATHAAAGARALRVVLDIDNPTQELRPGLFVTARLKMPVQQIEPFRSMPTGLPPQPSPAAGGGQGGGGDLRQVFVCPDHPEHLYEKPGRCPLDQKELEPRLLAANQRLGWWCPMHPKVTADEPGHTCPECGGMKLEPRVITYNPPGEVPAVPESAVVDTGSKKVVYVERMPGMFEGVEVVLGPRCGGSYPVVRGVEVGQNVVTAGAFLLDAESRLNPSVAAGYFGAGRGTGPSPAPAPRPPSESAEIAEALSHLSAQDRALAEKQKVCPVTGQALGSMGTPPVVTVEGRKVFLCCKGCEAKLRKEPGKYLKKLEEK